MPMRRQHNDDVRKVRIARVVIIFCVLGTIMVLTGCGGSALPPQPVATDSAAVSTVNAVVETATAMGSVAPTGTPAADTSAVGETCAEVTRIAANSAEGQAIGQAILDALPAGQPPDLQQLAPFEFDEIQSIEQIGDRVVVQASFTQGLEPAILVLHQTAAGYRYDTVGWAGQAGSVSQIREALRRELPDVPAALVDCLQISDWFVG